MINLEICQCIHSVKDALRTVRSSEDSRTSDRIAIGRSGMEMQTPVTYMRVGVLELLTEIDLNQ